jgi:hypothetical protein
MLEVIITQYADNALRSRLHEMPILLRVGLPVIVPLLSSIIFVIKNANLNILKFVFCIF